MPDTEVSSPGLIQLPAQTANNLPPPEKFSRANSPQQAELTQNGFVVSKDIGLHLASNINQTSSKSEPYSTLWVNVQMIFLKP